MDNQTPVNMDLNPSPTGGVAKEPTIIDQLNPTQIYFGTQLATNSQAMSRAADYLPLFQSGKTPMDVYNNERTVQQSQEVMNNITNFHSQAQDFVEKTKDLSDSEYEKAKAQFVDANHQLLTEQQNTPQREKVKTKMPDALSLGFALFGAAMNPRFASGILAAPFHASLDVQQAKQGEADKKYEDQLNQHREKLQVLGTIAQQAYKDVESLREQTSTEAKRLSSAISKMLTANFPGEAKIALQEAVDAGLPPDRLEVYTAMVNAKEEALNAQFKGTQAKTEATTEATVQKTEAGKALLPGQIEGQAATNAQKAAQTARTQQQMAQDEKLLPGKLKEQEAKLNRIAQQNEKDKVQIAKWEQQYNLAKDRGSLAREKFEWQKRDSNGIPALDKKVITLQERKAGLIAEAQTWKGQNSAMGGLIKRETPQMNQAVAKIQREVANIDAQIKKLRGFGAQAPISGEVGAKAPAPTKKKSGFAPVKPIVPQGWKLP